MVIDIVVIAVLLLSGLIAFLRGFIREVLTILGVVGGLAAAYLGGPVFSPFIKNMLGVVEGEEPKRLLGLIPYPILADILSYGLIFLVVVIVLSIVSHVLAETVRSVGLGSVDRTLGFIFGLVRGALLLGVLYLPVYLSMDAETKEEWFAGSKTHVQLEAVSAVLAGYLPQSAVEQIKETTQQAGEGSEVKEKLQQIDLLKGEDPKKLEETAPKEGAPGYDDEFRQKMNELFKDAAPQPPNQPQQGTAP